MTYSKLRWLIFELLTVAFTPIVSEAVTKQRGYFAFGGEWLLPLIPVVVYLVKKTIVDMFKEFRK
jgi:hypothetical protein